jgi:four helix bundle protein
MTEKRKKIESFEDLLVWQKGMEVVKRVYLLSRQGELGRDFALRDQLRRAAISISTNIAEGFERTSRKEYVNFLNFAKGSTGEVRSLLNVAFELGYLESSQYQELRNAVMELSRYLSNPIKSLRSCGS